ncbi:hypothetical protein EV121DRAFT_183188, partial [Schizophyllum commune]
RERKPCERPNIPWASSDFQLHARQESSLSFPISRSADFFFYAKRRECHLAVIVNPCLCPPQA